MYLIGFCLINTLDHEVKGLFSLFGPGLCSEDLLLLFFVIFVDLVDTLNLLHAVGHFPCFLSRAASCHTCKLSALMLNVEIR